MTLKGQTRDPNSLKTQYLENYFSYRLQIWYAALYGECLAGAHVTPTIFGSTVGYPSYSLASCYMKVPSNYRKSETEWAPTPIFRYHTRSEFVTYSTVSVRASAQCDDKV